MSLYEVYVIQNATVMEMKVREGSLIKKVHTSNNIVSNMKKKFKETKQKAKTWEVDRNMLKNVLTLTCNNFADEGITKEMFVESKVIQLGKIVDDLCKKVKEL